MRAESIIVWSSDFEEWKDIIGYEGYYQISNFGNVKSLERRIEAGISRRGFRLIKERILKPRIDNLGYYGILLSFNNIKRGFRIHRLVGIHFIHNPENKTTINHIDGIKTNNHISNLEWNTYSENNQHAFDLGLK